MAYNTKPIVTDVDGNPISQYYNPDTDSYEPVEGQAGANKVVLYNADGTENNSLSLIPILEKLSELTGTVIDEQTRQSNEQQRITFYNQLVEMLNTGQLKGDKGDTGETGRGLEFDWDGTRLGVRVEGDEEYIYVDLRGPQGPPGEIENLTSQHIEDALGYTPVKSVNNVLADEAGNVELDIDTSEIENRIGNVEDDLAAHKADYASLFLTNADAKNSIYRGKYLGNTVTAEQYTAISSGTFTDLYIGDYWTIGGVDWRIAAFNYYRNTGDSLEPGNHITIVPDTQLYTHVMNDTDITTGGYIGSKMYTEGLEQAKTIIRGIFGTHLVKHRQILSNATVDGKASGWAWLDSEVELMNEIMVYGASVFGAGDLGGGSGHNIGVGKSQLPLFRLNPRMINTKQSYWLRDVVSASHFAYVGYIGYANSRYASFAFGVRPAFSIS